jgi:hypothetical protein
MEQRAYSIIKAYRINLIAWKIKTNTFEVKSTGCRIIIAVSLNSQAREGEYFYVIAPGRLWDVDSELEDMRMI